MEEIDTKTRAVYPRATDNLSTWRIGSFVLSSRRASYSSSSIVVLPEKEVPQPELAEQLVSHHYEVVLEPAICGLGALSHFKHKVIQSWAGSKKGTIRFEVLQ